MTKNEFNNLCALLYIHPSVALENEAICEALRNGASEDEIAELLESEI